MGRTGGGGRRKPESKPQAGTGDGKAAESEYEGEASGTRWLTAFGLQMGSLSMVHLLLWVPSAARLGVALMVLEGLRDMLPQLLQPCLGASPTGFGRWLGTRLWLLVLLARCLGGRCSRRPARQLCDWTGWGLAMVLAALPLCLTLFTAPLSASLGPSGAGIALAVPVYGMASCHALACSEVMLDLLPAACCPVLPRPWPRAVGGKGRRRGGRRAPVTPLAGRAEQQQACIETLLVLAVLVFGLVDWRRRLDEWLGLGGGSMLCAVLDPGTRCGFFRLHALLQACLGYVFWWAKDMALKPDGQEGRGGGGERKEPFWESLWGSWSRKGKFVGLPLHVVVGFVVPLLLVATAPMAHWRCSKNVVGIPVPVSSPTAESVTALYSEEGKFCHVSVVSVQQPVSAHLPSFNVLKCDHSVLGGLFTNQESIFGIFYLQELVGLFLDDQPSLRAFHRLGLTASPGADEEVARAVAAAAATGDGEAGEVEEQKKKNKMNKKRSAGVLRLWGKQALVLGLGVGVAARGLQRLGASLDVVEVEPAVLRAAKKHFGFKEGKNDRIFVQDGLQLLDAPSPQLPIRSQYDFVLHDVFSGGGGAQRLYTARFLGSLGRLLGQNGVLGLNFWGFADPTNFGTSGATRLLWGRLAQHFTYIRCFRDEHKTEPVSNLVFFASNRPLVLPSLNGLSSILQAEHDRFGDQGWTKGSMRSLFLLNSRQWEVKRPFLTLSELGAALDGPGDKEEEYLEELFGQLLLKLSSSHFNGVEKHFPKELWEHF